MFVDFGSDGYGFMLCAAAAGILGSITLGIVGTVAVARNLVSVGGSVAHAVLGGIGAAFFFHEKFAWEWFPPLLGAVLAGMLAALFIGLAALYAKQREDTVIGIIWAAGMAAGLLLAGGIGHSHDHGGGLESFLFGDIQLLEPGDLIWLFAVAVVIILLVAIFHNWIFAVIFDREFAALRGVPANLVYLGILQIVALSVVMMVNMVGVLLVIALMSLPAAAAGEIAKKLSSMMILSCIFCTFFTVSGITAGFFADVSPGPVVVLIAVVVYSVIIAIKWFGRRKRKIV